MTAADDRTDSARVSRPAAFAHFVARAGEGRNSLPRIVFGSLLAVAVWLVGTLVILVGATFALLSMRGMPPDWIEALGALNALTETRFGTVAAIFSLAAIWPGVWLALRLFHTRRMNTLFGAGGRLDWSGFRRAALVTLAVAGALGLFGAIFEPSLQRSSLPLSTWLSLVPAMAVVLLLQTSAEEIFFRGYLLQSLAHRFRSPWIWAGAPTIVFALGHFPSGAQPWMAALIVLAIAVFALGAVALVRATGNLGAAMGFHFANNLVALLLVASSTDQTSLALFVVPPVDDPGWTPGDALAAGLQQIAMVACVLGLLLWRRSPFRIGEAPPRPAPVPSNSG